ncbi:sca1 complex scaffold protein scaa [Anaeramoeba ignava]|uniref:Sca1 complex scaffold protein scaa n=1 Tax=Anaeramoeba ignava TaxID=1746090 RepID=A0A9Q0LI17_ANAIG|nr:sca1 complex scaffold protein scaa [Anaeramoeba ignava]
MANQTIETEIKSFQGLRSEYTGPNIIPKEIKPTRSEKKIKKKFPVFVDPQGNLYDINFLPIEDKESLLKEYDDIDKASVKWIDDMEKSLGYLRIPTILGRTYARPREVRRGVEELTEEISEITLLESETDLLTETETETEIEMETDYDSEWDKEDNAQVDDLKKTRTRSGSDLSKLNKAKSSNENENNENIQKTEDKDQSNLEEKKSIEDENENDNENDKNQEDLPRHSSGHRDSIERESNITDRENVSMSTTEKTKDKELIKLDPIQEFQLYKILDKGLNIDQIEKEKFTFDINRVLFKKDPWNSLLIPEEPIPQHYKTLAEFDRAYKRWAQVCVQFLENIPLHAKQFQEQSGLKPVDPQLQKRKKQKKLKQDFFRDYSSWRRNIFLQIASISVNAPFEIEKDTKFLTKTFKTTEPSEPLEEEKKNQLHTLLAKMKNKLSSKERIQNLCGKFHGVAWGYGTTLDISTEINPNDLTKLTKVPAVNLSVFLTRSEIKENSRKNCSNNIQGKSVQFDIPAYDVKEVIDWTKVTKNEKYLDDLRKQIHKLGFFAQFDHLQSGWAISIRPPTMNDELLEKIQDIVKNSNPFTIKEFFQILSLPQLLDLFQRMLSKNIPEQKSQNKMTYLEFFQTVVTPEHFIELLDEAENSKSLLTQSKISSFITSLLLSKNGKSYLEPLISEQNISRVYQITNIVSMFNDKRVDIFPFNEELISLVKVKFGAETKMFEFANFVSMYYYLKILKQILDQQVISLYLERELQKSFVFLINLLEEFPNIIEKDIFKGISSRSSLLSGYFLFVTIQLLYLESSELFRILRSTSVNMVFRLRNLGGSKFLHSQMHSRFMWNLMRQEKHLDFFATNYGGAVQNITDDLFVKVSEKRAEKKVQIAVNNENIEHEITDQEVEKKKQVEIHAKKQNQKQVEITKENIIPQPPYIAVLSAGFGKFIYENITVNQQLISVKQVVLFSESLYHEITSKIDSYLSSKQLNVSTGINCVGFFLSSMLKCLINLNLITTEDGEKTQKISKKKSGKGDNKEMIQDSLKIDLKQFQLIQSFLRKSSERDYQFKSHIMDCLRSLMKNHEVFKLVSQDLQFVTVLQDLCFDESNFAFNRNCWKTFYQMIYYHFGFCQFLIEKENLPTFLTKALGKKSTEQSRSMVLPNSLFYLSKLLLMNTIEKQRLKKGKQPARSYMKDAVRSLKKDVELISEMFIKKHFFVRLHILYTKFVENNAGAEYISIAKIYHTIGTQSILSKLLREAKKSQNYIDGIEKVKRIFVQ